MEKVAVVGLGYVGLPVALAFARKVDTIGFDIHAEKVAELARGHDRNREVPEEVLKSTSLRMTSKVDDLRAATFFVVAVPTPVDGNNVPDLTPLERASETLGKVLKKGDVVVFESTVYPGVTEEVCGPILARTSGLAQGKDFKLGYSPERINPGDTEHTLERITKVVSGEDAETLERVASMYGRIIDAGVHRAPSIKVAEAAKVIENTQRDINIALMNELAIIFDRMGIRTADVLAAAATKWNFLKFRPGLVGGHCIGVDPYYLTTKAQQLGYQPEVIIAGRRINDNVGRFVAQRLVKLLVNADVPVKGARVGVLGLTFKEDVTDIRNSKVPDIVRELREFGISALVHDPIASPAEVKHEYGLTLCSFEELRALDAVVLAVSHKAYAEMGVDKIVATLRDGGVLVDVKSFFEPSKVDPRVRYWSL
jgi:UDP-N-acetyl-D-glucosamine/UDP-N-acetyl-D-galactosamine dehydrogenase